MIYRFSDEEKYFISVEAPDETDARRQALEIAEAADKVFGTSDCPASTTELVLREAFNG